MEYLDQIQVVLDELKCISTGDSQDKAALVAIESILMKIMTELSFQDLTGQQIRMVIRSLKRVDELVYEVYLLSEALKKTKQKSPQKDIHELKEEARELVRDLKTKSDIVDQAQIDALFEEHGF